MNDLKLSNDLKLANELLERAYDESMKRLELQHTLVASGAGVIPCYKRVETAIDCMIKLFAVATTPERVRWLGSKNENCRAQTDQTDLKSNHKALDGLGYFVDSDKDHHIVAHQVKTKNQEFGKAYLTAWITKSKNHIAEKYFGLWDGDREHLTLVFVSKCWAKKLPGCVPDR